MYSFIYLAYIQIIDTFILNPFTRRDGGGVVTSNDLFNNTNITTGRVDNCFVQTFLSPIWIDYFIS